MLGAYYTNHDDGNRLASLLQEGNFGEDEEDFEFDNFLLNAVDSSSFNQENYQGESVGEARDDQLQQYQSQ